MCGIYGFTTKTNKTKKENILDLIGSKIKYRGPNQSGKFINNRIALGIERLSIIDPQNGNQPIFSNDKNYVIVHNGEIYNYKELKNKLVNKGYYFSTESDTEVIVNLFQHYGVQCFKKLNGMFAFAIYDIKRDRLIIARDRYGIKPIYYYKKDSSFIFASELKAIKSHPDIECEISSKAIDLYFTMEYVPTPLSIYKNIYKMEQGSFLNIQGQKLKKETWYDLPLQSKIIIKSENEYVEDLDYLINQSVKLRMRSDVPIGTFLSGGLDSSLIAYYLSKNLPKKLKTFHIGFENASFDETKYSENVSKLLDTEHYSNVFTSDELVSLLPKIWSNMDEPFSDASLLPMFMLSYQTKKHVTVSLSGDGGDEIFGGYPTYLAHRIADNFPSFLTPIFYSVIKNLPVSFDNISFDFKLKKFFSALKYSPVLRHQYWMGSFDYNSKITGYNSGFLNKTDSGNYIQKFLKDMVFEYQDNPNWDFHLYQDMKYYLNDDMLVKVDRASMANSLEVRVPFLDHNIVEYMSSVPKEMKYNGLTSKFILKKLAKNYLPNTIVYRKKKGFGIPIGLWFNSFLKSELKDIIRNPNSFIHNFFSMSFTNKMMENHFEKKYDNRKLLWTLFVIENWKNNEN